MAENLIWLINEWYPEEKIIVWMHNQHISRNGSTIERIIPGRPSRQPYSDWIETGDLLYREIGRSMYSIAFLTYQGTRSQGLDKKT